MKKIIIGLLFSATPLWAASGPKIPSEHAADENKQLQTVWQSITTLLQENAEIPYLNWQQAPQEKMSLLSGELKKLSETSFAFLEAALQRYQSIATTRERTHFIKALKTLTPYIYQIAAFKKHLEETVEAPFDFTKPKSDSEKNKFAEEVIWKVVRDRMVAISNLLAIIEKNHLAADKKLVARLHVDYTAAQDNLAVLVRLVKIGNGENSMRQAGISLDQSTALVKLALEMLNSMPSK